MDFRDKMIFHTHVEKAAGTTLIHGLQAALGRDHVHDLRSPTAIRPTDMGPVEKSKIWALTGHFHYGAHMAAFSRRKACIATIRHPFDRFRSFIYYINPNHPAYKYIEGKTFAQITEEYLRNKRPQATNQMARVLTGSDNPTLAMTKENIEEHYLFVAPHKRVNEALSTLVEVAGAKPIKNVLHSNKGTKTQYEDIGDLQKKFDVANALDIDLHNYVIEMFDSWMSNAEERWKSVFK